MADLKISQLGPISESDVVSTDVLPVADVSADQTKKISSADLVKAGARLNTGAVTFGGNLIVTGDLNVNGTTTTIDTQNLLVEDKNVVIGNVASPTDVTANGGGITLKGTTDKTLNWVDSTDSWTSSENVDLASGKSYRINNASVLDSTTLGSGVVNSSLTSIGTVTTGTWSASTIAVDKGGTGQTSYTDGQILIGNSTGNTLTKSTLTAGTGVTITNGNGSITINATGSGGTVTSVTGTSPIASSGGTTPNITIQDGTTSQKGAVQLENSTSSTSTTKAATPSSVKTAYDLASAALPLAGGTLTGALGVTAGSATAPSVFISGDTNTGIYSPGADQVAISTNGTGRLFVDANGLCDVQSASSSVTRIGGGSSFIVRRAETSYASPSAISASVSVGGIAARGYGNTDYKAVGNLLFFTDGAVSDVSSPGFAAISTTPSGSVAPTERLRITSDGKVGIGTSSPNQLLQISSSGASGGQLQITNASTGTASTDGLLIGYDGSNDVIINNQEATQLKISVNGSERARIDSSGRLLVGTSSAAAVGGYNGIIQVKQTSDACTLTLLSEFNNIFGSYLVLGKSRGVNGLVNNGDTLGAVMFAGGDGTDVNTPGAVIEAYVDGTPGANDMPCRLVFSTTADGASSPTERMRIRSDGAALFGTTTTPGGTQYGHMIYGGFLATSVASTGSSVLHAFYNPNGYVGGISTAGSSTAYATSSDYRLKENVVPLTGAIDRINQLQVRRFNFIADPDKTVDGFIAHEAQAVVPECVTGTKDEVDADGKPVYQGIDQSKLVPLLTAALQEALAEIESLKARVTALEP